MILDQNEEELLRSVALQNARAVLLARERAEHALRGSEARFRAIFHQAAVGITITSLEGRFEEMNARCSQILGYSAEELRKLTLVDVTHPDDRKKTVQTLGRLRAEEIVENILERRYLRKDGSVVWSLTAVTVL